MKIKVSGATKLQLNWLVASIEGAVNLRRKEKREELTNDKP